MAEAIRFIVPGQPVGKGRPRVGNVGGFSRLYTPEKTVSYENLVGYSAAQAMKGRPLIDSPVSVTLHIGVQIPASWSGAKRRRALAGVELPTTKPDIDNVEKVIFDGMNGVVWKDDVQVVDVCKTKRYSLTPGVSVEVSICAGFADSTRDVQQQALALPQEVAFP
jgi:Holliday junction resolvase RusA-like endonuclease